MGTSGVTGRPVFTAAIRQPFHDGAASQVDDRGK